MKLTKHANCTNIILQSEYIDDFVNSVTPNELTIKLYRNCKLVTEIIFEAVMYEALVEGITLDTELYNQSGDKLSDGIYGVEIIDKNTERIIKDYSCAALLCGTRCNIMEYVASNLTSHVYALYKVLDFVDVCTDCNCDDACVIFDELTSILTDSKKIKPCGNC